MKWVIIRDDDTNAFTPVECLERLYRPFLDRGLAVNLATIPNVSTRAKYADGRSELFLLWNGESKAATVPIGENIELVDYLLTNPLYHIVQHGCRHESVDTNHEFDHDDGLIVRSRLDEGTRLLMQAGFRKPTTFVAPYDRLSTVSLRAAAERFRVVSTGWYEWRRLPFEWWPNYALKKARGAAHWRVGQTTLLSHPGCHLSYHRSYDAIPEAIRQSIDSQQLTVLVTHWWEYFRDKKPDDRLIDVLHQTAHYLASRKDVQVISFDDLLYKQISLN
jgi:hypothetical protein